MFCLFARFCFLFFLFIQPFYLRAQEEKKMPKKILVLVHAIDSESLYVNMQKIWRSYMHLDPEKVEVYFVKSNTSINTDYRVDGDIVWCNVPQGFIPGVVNKSILALECFADRLEEFDYVIRTSVTVIFDFPILLSYLRGAPKTSFFAGPHIRCGDLTGEIQEWGGFYYGGPVLIFSRDVVRVLLEGRESMFNNMLYTEDAVISAFLFLKNIPMIPMTIMQFPNIYWWWLHKDMLPEQVIAYRVDYMSNPFEYLQEIRNRDEIYILRELVEKLYKVKCPLDVDKHNFELRELLWRSQERPWKVWQDHFKMQNSG